MISSAFKSAYVNQIEQQNKGINTISSGVKTAATATLGIAGYAGALGEGVQDKMQGIGQRIFGLGGAFVSAMTNEKEGTVTKAQAAEAIVDKDYKLGVEDINSQLSGNPINNAAIKKLNTVFEKLTEFREQGILNKKGNIESSIGEIDPSSELGKKILQEDNK